MELETATHRQRGVTLVAVRVLNDGEHAQRVRVANRCDGPVLPPREQGVPALGWDDGGWEGVVAAGAAEPLGYATPALPSDPPVEVTWSERAGESEPTAAETLADLGDPRPPADAVSPPTTVLPEAVREWLAAVDERATTGETTDADRDGVAALAARASRLREDVE
ncbi:MULTISPECIES: hypothetical protein [Halobacterium]|uniref:DUF7857 domain-containing protein n=1 Tax=Halobacterium TaxID=2239 RepID=UPI00073EEB4D|nr:MULTISPECIES: hypothetical protein [Halobacterium]MCG1004282.1 hypothetical protein [Halobacterium noricense]